MDQAYNRLAEGFVAAGRIAWHPEPAVEEAAPSRWINVVFLQGDEADRPLRILGELEHVDAVDYLAQWDYGHETTQETQPGEVLRPIGVARPRSTLPTDSQAPIPSQDRTRPLFFCT